MDLGGAITSVAVGNMSGVLRDIELSNGLKVDEVHVRGGLVHVDVAGKSLQLGTPAEIEAKISEASLLTFVGGFEDAKKLKHLKIELSDGVIKLSGAIQVLFEVAISVGCRLVIEEKTRLVLELVKADAIGVPVKSLATNLLAKVNPIFDVAALPAEIELERTTVADGAIIVAAAIKSVST